jgi:hypothetical protein
VLPILTCSSSDPFFDTLEYLWCPWYHAGELAATRRY